MKWTVEQNEQVFETYNFLIECQENQVSVVKNQHVMKLAEQLGRTKKAIECKFQNLSAIRLENGMVPLQGYKALPHYAKATKEHYLEWNK